MARTGKISAVEVAKVKRLAVLHDGGGLYLRVTESGAKSWVFRFQIGGKQRDMGLGPYPALSLAEARLRAAAHRQQHQSGIDPLDAKVAERQAQRVAEAKGRTFQQSAEEYIRRNETAWRNATHRQQWHNSLATYVYPILDNLPVSAINTGLVMQVLEPIWLERPETASRVRGRIEVVLDAATVSEYREGLNPARWRGHLDKLLAPPAKAKKARRQVTGRAEHHPDEVPNSSLKYGIELGCRLGLWSSRSLQQRELARYSARHGAKSMSMQRHGLSPPIA